MSRRTWRQEAAEIIQKATRDLPPDTPLKQRIAAVDAARPVSWHGASWPQKAWQAARRDYLIPYGYRPRRKPSAGGEQLSLLPLFPDL